MSYEDEITNRSSNPHINELIESRLQDPARRGMLRGGLGAAALSFIGGDLPDRRLRGQRRRDRVRRPCAGARRRCRACPGTRPLEGSRAEPADGTRVHRGAEVARRRRRRAGRLHGERAAAPRRSDRRRSQPTMRTTAPTKRAPSRRARAIITTACTTSPSARPAPSENASSARGLLVQNHEAITPVFLHINGPTISGTGAAAARTAPDEVLKEYYVHGVSIVEVSRAADGTWSYRKNSPFNRRVHTLTEMELSGPAAGSSYMVTKYSADGTRTRGTVNNCANGYTPWGTYLTCEENWAGYFRRITATDNANRTAKELKSLARYGVGRQRPRTVGHGDAGHCRRPVRPLECHGARRHRGGRLPQRTEHLRLERRDRPVRAEVDAEEAHRDGPLRARRRLDRQGRGGQAARLVHGLRLAQRVHLQVRVERQLGPGRREPRTRARATSTSTTASCTSRSSTPTAPATGSKLSFGANGITAAARSIRSPTRPTS